MARSRCRVGWWEFSAGLFRYLDCRCSTDAITSRCGHCVTAERVGEQHPSRRALPLEEFAEAPRGGLGVAPAEDVEDVAVLVDGPPQMLPTAVDRQEHLVEMPFVGGAFPAAAQPAGVFRPNLAHHCRIVS